MKPGMNMSVDIVTILYFVGLALTIFWAFALLIIRQGNQIANRILAVLLFLISTGIVKSLLYQSKYIFNFPHLIGINWPIPFLYPPIFFLYVKFLISKEINLRKQLFHFLPFIVIVIYLIPFYVKGGQYKTDYLQSLWGRPPDMIGPLSILIVLQELIYFTLILRLLHKHLDRVKSIYSTLEKHTLNWIRILVIFYILVVGIFFTVQFFNIPIKSVPISPVAIVVFVYILGLLGVRQPEVFSEAENSQSVQKYLKSGLDKDKVDAYLRKLIRLMENDRLFADSDLTLYRLASELSISPNHLSQLLNEQLKKSFFDFVNFYRIEEAKKLLKEPKNNHLTILAIAYEVGFNSKSSFNSIFKKHVRMTPSQYKLTADT